MSVLLLLSCVMLCGCADNPGSWPREKVQAQITKSLELTDVSLVAKEGGGYEGTGMLGEETVSFTITQDPEARRMSWDAHGDRGLVETGFFELK